MKLRSRKLAFLVLLLGLGAVLGVAGTLALEGEEARHPPSMPSSDPVQAAIDYAHQYSADSIGRIRIRSLRVSTEDETYAIAGLEGYMPKFDEWNGVDVVLHRVGNGWRGIEIGTDGLGCKVPGAVMNELDLDCLT